MSRLRIKLELNPGGDGVRLDKLANISGELEKFLRSLGQDCGVSSEPGEWVAKEFYNGSMGALIEYVGAVDDPVVTSKFNAGIRTFSHFTSENDTDFVGAYSEATIRNFVAIGSRLDSDEIVKVGLYRNGKSDETPDNFEWQKIAKRTAIDVEEATLKPIYYMGSIQGTLGTWFKESDFIYLRDSVYGASVKCTYRPIMYETIHKCYRDKKAVVHITGRIKSERLSGHPKEVAVDHIERYDRLTDDEFAGMFGCAPRLIGDESVDDYLDRMRDDA